MINKVGIKEHYRYYRKNTENPAVSYKDYTKITNLYNKYLMDIVFSGYKVSLPMSGGTLEIVGNKTKLKLDENGKVKNLPVDWKATKEYTKNNNGKTKLIYHKNFHTDGYIYKFFWSKKKIFAAYKDVYVFKPTRWNKRHIVKLIREKIVQYKVKIL